MANLSSIFDLRFTALGATVYIAVFAQNAVKCKYCTIQSTRVAKIIEFNRFESNVWIAAVTSFPVKIN